MEKFTVADIDDIDLDTQGDVSLILHLSSPSGDNLALTISLEMWHRFEDAIRLARKRAQT